MFAPLKSKPKSTPVHVLSPANRLFEEQVIQRMTIAELPKQYYKDFKYSSRMGASYVLVPVGDQGWHLSFHPSGPGAEKWNEQVTAYLSGVYQENALNGWQMSNQDISKFVNSKHFFDIVLTLPFDEFHVTSPEGKHFFFKENGDFLGEKPGGASESDKLRAWQIAQIVYKGKDGAEYNWACESFYYKGPKVIEGYMPSYFTEPSPKYDPLKRV